MKAKQQQKLHGLVILVPLLLSLVKGQPTNEISNFPTSESSGYFGIHLNYVSLNPKDIPQLDRSNQSYLVKHDLPVSSDIQKREELMLYPEPKFDGTTHQANNTTSSQRIHTNSKNLTDLLLVKIQHKLSKLANYSTKTTTPRVPQFLSEARLNEEDDLTQRLLQHQRENGNKDDNNEKVSPYFVQVPNEYQTMLRGRRIQALTRLSGPFIGFPQFQYHRQDCHVRGGIYGQFMPCITPAMAASNYLDPVRNTFLAYDPFSILRSGRTFAQNAGWI